MMTTMMVFNLRWRRTGARGAPWLLVLSYILSHRIVTGNLDANLIYLLGPPTN